MAYYYILQDDWYLTPQESASKAKAAALKALEIDDSNSDAHLALAMELHWYERDWSASEREFQRAISLNPNSADTLVLYSRQWDPAIKQLRAAIDLDASFWRDHVFLGRAYEEKR